MNQGQQRIACPKCRSNNFLGQPNCWQCGSSLPPPEALTQAAAPVAQPFHAQPGGAPLAPFAQHAAFGAHRQKSSAWKIVVPVVLVVVVGVGVVLALSSKAQKQGQASVPKDIVRELDKLQSQYGKPMESTNSNDGPVDPSVAEAQRVIDKFRRENPGMAPPTDSQGNVHLQTGGTITREQWERANSAIRGSSGQ